MDELYPSPEQVIDTLENEIKLQQAEIAELVLHAEGLTGLISILQDKNPSYNHSLSVEISDAIDKHEALIAKHRGG